ncbi:TIGR03619 family F420-dependent LLM class oxidoreductase [Gordonia desulfuricans]|uniref:TIGR03619 family F420-dependent LLM class oxidoreductase n=1 Tax=Gordonia desulfuricans TaxID=89051 RepID=A0A7K3LUS8_9ACTN|nr:TIGR03619 family F420-dependent LLM class oxidoreductase [Gordonia desulfuricans]NDK91846.1 TIGR03619 family F420-dependent LLM class oxidoreductase [Gordonia desulfuricans]
MSSPPPKVGVASPIVTRYPGAHGEWESGAGIAELAAIAADADALGYDFLTCSEHVAVPVEVARERGGTYWDPLSTFGFLAARTRRIGLVTQVLVLGYHHPLEIAKRYGTLDEISGGRVTLGVGVGSLREEFDLLGASFDDRGARADDAMRALRSSLGRNVVEFHGRSHDYVDMVVDPCAAHPIPLWVGGRTRRSLRRAVELGDGWLPFALGGRELAAMLGEFDLPAGFDVVLAVGGLDPIGEPDRVRDRIGRLGEVGATRVVAGFTADSVDHYREQLAALADMYALEAMTP